MDRLLKPDQPVRPAQTFEAAAPCANSKRDPFPSASLSAIISDGNYSRVHTMDGRKFFMRRSMLEWRHLLAEAGFMKLSRSLIINSAVVVRLEVRSRDAAFLHMVGLAEALVLGRCAAQRARHGLLPTAANPASLAGSSQMLPDSSLIR